MVGESANTKIICFRKENEAKMIFLLLSFQPPNGTAQGANSSNEKKAKVYEQLKTLRILFKRLRLIYEKCNENCQGMEYTHIEVLLVHVVKCE
jgi:hypothetical protein